MLTFAFLIEIQSLMSFYFLVPQPVQFAAAYTLLDLSSIEHSTVLSQLSQWLQATTSDVPKSLRSEIASLVVSEQF